MLMEQNHTNPQSAARYEQPLTHREEAINAMAAPICDALGVELVEARIHGGAANGILRVTIDRVRPDGRYVGPGGVTTDDCSNVSRNLGAAIELANAMPGTYRLEVMSPGVEREVLKPSDYRRFLGERIKVVFVAPVAGRAFTVARLTGVSPEGVSPNDRSNDVTSIRLTDDSGEVTVDVASIKSANLAFEWVTPGKASKGNSGKQNAKHKHARNK